MPTDTPRCFGLKFDQLPECDACPERAWCQDGARPTGVPDCYPQYGTRHHQCAECWAAKWCAGSRDPKPMTGPNAGPTGDDAAWEAAAAVAQDTPSLPTTVPAASTAEALATIALAAQFNVDRLAMLTLRLLGLSYAEIGALCGKTKQAVAKDVAAVELMQPEIGRLVRAAFSVRLPMAERMAEHIATMGEAGKRTYRGMPVRLKRAVLAATYHVELTKGGRLTGANGVYGRVAARLGLRSWNTARVLMQRAADCCKMCKE